MALRYSRLRGANHAAAARKLPPPPAREDAGRRTGLRQIRQPPRHGDLPAHDAQSPHWRSWSRAWLAAAVAVWMVAGVPMAAQPVIRLASAQVVSADNAPPVLKLLASGPIAFTEIDPAEGAEGTVVVTARLHGVLPVPGGLATLGSLAPFVVTAERDNGDTILTVRAGAGTAEGTLRLRQGRRTSEIEAAFVLP